MGIFSHRNKTNPHSGQNEPAQNEPAQNQCGQDPFGQPNLRRQNTEPDSRRQDAEPDSRRQDAEPDLSGQAASRPEDVRHSSPAMRHIKDTADEALRFVIVGVLNTVLGAALTFGFYNLADMGYFLSSVLSYILASVFSFFMNKKFTFRNDDALRQTAVRFALNVAVCYTLAFGFAKPAVLAALAGKGLSKKITDNLALLTGMVLFTVFNFFGQKFFAFRKK